MDAATELAGILELVEGTRGDLAELGHEMRRELGVIKVRLDTCATKADIQELRIEIKGTSGDLCTKMQSMSGELAVSFERGLRAQGRWMLAMLAMFLIAVYFRT